MTVVFPGSFDPVTYGHMDIIERASKLFEKVVVAVLCNSAKNPTFTINQRIDILKDATKHLDYVQIKTFDGLLVDFLKEENISLIIKGIRSVTDYEYEWSIAAGMKQLLGDVETIFMPTSCEYMHISSSMVKEIARYRGDITNMVPESSWKALNEKYCFRGRVK